MMGKGMKRMFALTGMMLITGLLAACGGGGSSPTAATTTVSGVASKGPIKNGTVKVYAVKADGNRGAQVGTTTTDDSGNYEIKNMAYTGNVIVEITGGTYKDEANPTNGDVPNPGLKAAVPAASGTVKIAVTPLTDIAFKQMSSAAGGFSAENIAAKNALVSTAFGVNITGTQPVDATDSAKIAAAQQGAIDYGMALAAFSKMVATGAATSVKDAIEQIKTDLSDNRLDSTGPKLTAAITALITDNNTAPAITANTITVAQQINHFTTYTVTPPPNPTGDAQAKSLIRDLRNTVLSVVDYRTGEINTAIKTPFDAAAQELQTVVQPELTGSIDMLGWVLQSVSSIPNLTPDTTYPFDGNFFLGQAGNTMTVTTGPTGLSAIVIIKDAQDVTVFSGTITVDDINFPTTGTLNISMLKTLTGNATIEATFTGTRTTQFYSAMKLTGKIVTPVASFDFSDAATGQKLEIGIGMKTNLVDSAYLTKAYFKGVAATSKLRVTGTIDVPTLVLNSNIGSPSGNLSIPTAATVSGKIEALNTLGAATLTLNGTLAGTFTNAATYNPLIPESSSNFPNWAGTFNGSLVSTSGINIAVLLKASMTTYQVVNFEVKYTRTLADGSTVFLGGSGTFNTDTELMAATLTNQDGMSVALSYDGKAATDSQFTGTIKTSGNMEVATFSTVREIPRVTYKDGFFETLM